MSNDPRFHQEHKSISIPNNKEAKFPPLFWFHFFGLALPTTYWDGENQLKSTFEAELFTDQCCYVFYSRVPCLIYVELLGLSFSRPCLLSLY
jgi:hypothetical protein